MGARASGMIRREGGPDEGALNTHSGGVTGLPLGPYGVALISYALGGMMKVFWLLLAVLLTCLTIGGLMSAAKGADGPSVIGDLVISALLGAGAVGSWKRVKP